MSPSPLHPGRVTGFLGPNGAGKSTTMIVGLDSAAVPWGEGACTRPWQQAEAMPAAGHRAVPHRHGPVGLRPSEHSGDIAPLATVLGLLLVIENLAQTPWKPLQLISPLLPGAAGSKILMTQAQISAISHGSMGAAILGPWQGFAVLLAWVAVLLRHRNA